MMAAALLISPTPQLVNSTKLTLETNLNENVLTIDRPSVEAQIDIPQHGRRFPAGGSTVGLGILNEYPNDPSVTNLRPV